jgi:hypothetical protein
MAAKAVSINYAGLLFHLFFNLSFYAHFFQVDAYQGKQAHIYIGYKYQCKTCYDISPPIIKQQLIIGEEKHGYRYIMTKTILAGKQVKKLTLGNGFSIMATFKTILPWLLENLFMGYRPGYTGYRDSQNKQPDNLCA